MNQIDTGIDLVYRFDNALDEIICDQIVEHVKANTNLISFHNDPANKNQEPYNYSLDMFRLPAHLKEPIVEYADKLAGTIQELAKQTTFTETGSVVYWKPGTSMLWHPDIRDPETMTAEELEGIPKNASLFTRTFTAITYLNDDYEGGETVVCEKTLAPWNLAKQLISKPKKGSVIIYHSACFHKVNEIKDADRFTLAMFFCKDYEHSHWKSIGKEPQ